MDWILGMLARSVEYQNIGWNPLFLGALGTMFFTMLQAYGIWKQGRRVWESCSGAGVSATFFGYAMFYFLAFLVYGAERWSIAMTINGCLGFLHIPIIAGLHRFKGFTRRERILLSYIFP